MGHGTKDKLYHGWGLTFSTKIDPATLALVGQSSTQAITSSGSLAVTFTKIGKPVTVQAVNTATDVTADVLAQFPNSSSTSSTGSDSGAITITVPGSGNQPAPEAVIPDDATTLYADLQAGTSADGFATLGDPKAPVQIVQYSSYSCSFCQDYYNSKIVPILDEIQSGNVYYTFVPVTLTGEFDSTPETKAAYCALQQGKYWEMHDVLFDWQTRYGSAAADVDRLSAGAKGLDMNVSKFNTCVKSSKADQFVQAANDSFNQQNLTGTPSILINGTLFHPVADGATEPDLREYIDQLASGGGEATPSASGN